MKKFKIHGIFLLLSIMSALASCQDQWDGHISASGSETGKNLYQIITERAEFSKFAELLNKSGYSEDLQSSKNFTVILPDNDAIDEAAKSVDFADTAALKAFVGYHIINSVYTVNSGVDTVRAKNLRNKYVDFVNSNFNNIVPSIGNQVAQNGVYHVVKQALTPYKNIYSFIMTFNESNLQKAALRSFDTLKTVGEKIVISQNATFFNDVFRPMVTERQKYTYFLVADAFFDQQYKALEKYYQTSYLATGTRPDSTTEFFTRLNLLRDLIVPGDFAENNMPDTLTSVSGFKFQVDKSKIISSHITSNGRVYYVSSLPYKLKDQIREFKVLGNLPSGFSQADKSGNTYYRTKIDLNGKLYNDIQVYNHDVAEFFINYVKRAAYKGKYKVFGRAVSGLAGDPQSGAFTQYLHFYNPITKLFNKPVLTPAGVEANRFTFAVAPRYHEEIELGIYEQSEFGNLALRLVSSPTRSVNQNTLMLEYLRFEPVLPQ